MRQSTTKHSQNLDCAPCRLPTFQIQPRFATPLKQRSRGLCRAHSQIKGGFVPLQATTKTTATSTLRTARHLIQGCFYMLSLVFVQAYLCLPAVGQSLSKGIGDLRVMTYNANEGSD